MIVIDASATGAIVLDDEPSPPPTIRATLIDTPLIAPAVWPTEVANLILMAERRQRTTERQRGYLFDRIEALRVGVRRSDERAIWNRGMQLAAEHRLTIYDAAYLELALRVGAGLVTLDRDLRDAAGSCGVAILTWSIS